MKNLNSFLLSKFSSDTELNPGPNAISLRYQTLAIIYLNLIALMAILIIQILVSYFSLNYDIRCVIYSFPITMTIALFMLKRRSTEYAAFVTLLAINWINIIVSGVCKMPALAICGQLVYPVWVFLLVRSARSFIINAIISQLLFLIYMKENNEIFNTTYTEEQEEQITVLYIASLLGHLLISLTLLNALIMESSRKRAQEDYDKLHKTTEEILELLKAKDAFISSLSHEIRNPLSAIKGSIDYLYTILCNNAQYKDILAHAKVGCEVLLNILNNCLDAAKLRADKMDVIYRETDVEKVIEKVLNINTQNLNAKKLSVKVLFDERVPKEVRGDESRLIQILMNLLSNSIKFTQDRGKIIIFVKWMTGNQKESDLLSKEETHSGEFLRKSTSNISKREIDHKEDTIATDLTLNEFQSEKDMLHFTTNLSLVKFPNPTLESSMAISTTTIAWKLQKINTRMSQSQDSLLLTSHDKVGFLKLQISDNGCGISLNDIGQLFQMFAQTSEGSRPVYKGTGLGLWVCKQLCQKMGGDIKVYSEVDKGTTIVFYLPINSERIEETPRRTVGRSGSKINALVVHNSSFERDLFKVLLEREGVQVVLASNGKDAMENLKVKADGYFDFVIMDINMPVNDGIQVAMEIRRWEKRYKKKMNDIYFVIGDKSKHKDIKEVIKEKMGDEKIENKILRAWPLIKPVDIEVMRKLVEKYTRNQKR